MRLLLLWTIAMAASTRAAVLIVHGSGDSLVNGDYAPQNPAVVPAGFRRTCEAQLWDPEAMWRKLSDGRRHWYLSPNDSYIYFNVGDGNWWIDEPGGGGVYIVPGIGDENVPPPTGWQALPGAHLPVPVVEARSL